MEGPAAQRNSNNYLLDRRDIYECLRFGRDIFFRRCPKKIRCTSYRAARYRRSGDMEKFSRRRRTSRTSIDDRRDNRTSLPLKVTTDIHRTDSEIQGALLTTPLPGRQGTSRTSDTMRTAKRTPATQCEQRGGPAAIGL